MLIENIRTERVLSLVSAILLAVGVFQPAVGYSQLTESDRANLSSTIRSARQTIGQRPLPAFEVVKSKVLASAQGVEDYFRPITSQSNLEQWIRYLRIDPLREALGSGAEDDIVLERAQATRGRMIGNVNGLELPALLRLRDDVDRLITALRFKDTERSIKTIDQQLIALDERLADLQPIPTADETASLAALAKLIDESNQAPQVIGAMRSVFASPNVVVSVGSPFVQRAANQWIDRNRPINDCILGTRVIGQGNLRGSLTARTLSSVGTASVELVLSGTFHSQSIGYNGPVTLNTIGDGEIMSTRTLFISESGISLAPTTTTGNLRTRITSINHPLKIVRKIAKKRAAQQKPQADAIANSRFRNQVGSEFDAQVTQAVAGAPTGKRDEALCEARTTLARLYLPEPSRAVGSSEKAIYVEAFQTANDQFAAINPAPPLAANSFDFAVQVHESTVDNVASRVLAGRTMTRAQLDRLIANVGGAPQADASQEDFEIDFARLRPIIFEARDQMVRIGLRGTRFKQGDRDLTRPIEITATYLPVKNADGTSFLLRQGEVGVDFPGGRRLTMTQVALRRSIQKAFDERFPPTLLDQAIVVPPTVALETIRGQHLRATTVDARNGWMSVLVR